MPSAIKLQNLHSNMVLFKSNILKKLNALIFSFTFQYGSIQIRAEAEKLNTGLRFTFQYGSIQIH